MPVTRRLIISEHFSLIGMSGLLLVLLLTGLNTASLKAQEYVFKEVIRDREFDGGDINILHEDSTGFIWLGATTGLFRIEGNGIERILLPDSLAKRTVTAFASPDQENILIGLNNGVILKYNYFLKKMSYYGSTLKNSKVNDILVSGQDIVWVASYDEGVICLGDSLIIFHEQNGMLSDYTYCLEMDKLGRIWSGTDGGINIISSSFQNLRIDSILPLKGLSDYMVTALQSNRVGEIFIGFESGHLEKIIPLSDQMAAGEFLFQFDDRVDKILWLAGELWILSNGSCFVYSESSEPNSRKISFSGINPHPGEIRDMILDSHGNVWMAGENALLISPAATLTMLSQEDDFSYRNSQAAISDKQGRLLFSIRNKLFMLDIKTGGKPRLIFSSSPNSSIISLYEDFMGIIWIGMFNEGLSLIDLETLNIRRLTSETELNDNNILAISGENETVWISSLGGVFKIYPNRELFNDTSYPDKDIFEVEKIPNLNFVYDIHCSRDNRTWFGTDGDGLFSWSEGQLTNYPATVLKNAVILSISEDVKGNLWIGTADLGFFMLNGNGLRQFNSETGLRSDKLEGLETDGEGNVVILHQQGIDLYDPEQDIYFYLDDLTDADLQGIGFNSISRDDYGSIWITSTEGIVRYLPKGITKYPLPKTLITSVEVLNERIDHFSMNKFKYSQNHFRFTTTSIWNPAPERIRYRYRLEDIEPNWSESSSTQISYSALPPGSYTFTVQSSFNNDFKKDSEVSYAFIIQKPLWRKGWFVALALIILLLTLLWIVRKREKRYHEREVAARRQLSLQLENLQNQVNPHFLFNSFNTLVSIIDEDSKVAIDYVEHMADFFRNVLLYRDRDLIPVHEELGLLHAYTYLQKKRYGDSLTIEISLTDEVQESLIPPLTLQILVENAVKHNIVSDNNPLPIKISGLKTGIVVENNLQPKKNAEPSTKTGLQNIINRYEMLGGKPVQVETNNNRFIVILPYISVNDQGSHNRR